MQILTTVKNFESFEKLSEKIGCKSFQKEGGGVGGQRPYRRFPKIICVGVGRLPYKMQLTLLGFLGSPVGCFLSPKGSFKL